MAFYAVRVVRGRMAEDPWAANGMLRTARIERWTVVLDGRDWPSKTGGSGTVTGG